MSVSKWAYNPKRCDGDFCPGCCDVCGKRWDVDEEDEEGETMDKIDKVLKGLECHFDPVCGCDACPYQADADDCYWLDLKNDATDLIREQQEEIQRLCDALKPEPPKEED